MPHLPGHRFHGPGTRYLNRVPIDRDDAIAKAHDIAYANAQKPSDVRKADLEAINEFKDDVLKTGNYHSAIGAAGLSVKYGVETLTGVLYPKRLPGGVFSSGHSSTPAASGSSVTSHRRTVWPMATRETEPGQIPAPPPQQPPQQPGPGPLTTNDDEPSATTENTGGNSQPSYTNSYRMGRTNSYGLTYKKKFQLYTCGFQFQEKDSNAHTALKTNFNDCITFEKDNPTPGGAKIPCFSILNTPYAVIDPNCLFYYMTFQEYGDLPSNCYATTARVKVKPIGYRLPFQTNSTLVAYANSTQVVQIGVNIGANMDLNSIITSYTADTDTTVIKEMKDLTISSHMLYGDATSIGACAGIPRHLNCYISFISPPRDNDYPTPMLTKLFKIFNIEDVRGTIIADYTHTFRNGTLKFPSTQIRDLNVTGIPEGTRSVQWYCRQNWRSATTPVDATKVGTCSYAKDGFPYEFKDGDQNPNTFAYTQIIEKSAYMQRNYGHFQEPDDVPVICFGVHAVQTNPAQATPSFAAVSVIWEVEFELDVMVNLDYPFAASNTAWLQSWDPNWGGHKKNKCFNAERWHMTLQGRRILPLGNSRYDGVTCTALQGSNASREADMPESEMPADQEDSSDSDDSFILME